VTATGGPPAIEVEGLAKRFGDVAAVTGISFDVRPVEIFGFLGPNGAGKTTTINMLTGLARPTAGTIRYFGRDYSHNVKRAQHLMGIVPDESNLYPELDGFENLCFCGALYGMTRPDREARARELLETFDLAAVGSRRFGQYSKGMKRKLTIAAGIMHRPPVLFLDEPTTGIDVASARHVRQLLAGMNRNGTTIFLTTHYIEEAERLCQRIAFIVAGRIVAVDTVEALLQGVKGQHGVELVLGKEAGALGAEIAEAFPGLACQASGPRLRLTSPERISVFPLLRFLDGRGMEVFEARIVRQSLEEVFVRITGIGADEMRKEREKQGGAAA
jgi:ABC-2 type transport system ATP-binding protein